MTQELIDLATWFGENYKTLAVTPGDYRTEGYPSKGGSYHIQYLANFDANGFQDSTGSPCRSIVNIYTPVVMQMAKELLVNTPAYNNANFAFGLVLWCAAINSLYMESVNSGNLKSVIDDLEADTIAFNEYLKHDRPLTDFTNGWFVLFQFDPTAENLRRSAALNFRINQLPKPENK